MFCSNCGTQLPDEARFCLNCGAPREGSQGSTQAEEVLYESPIQAILYDGRPNFLAGCHLTITNHRLIIDCARGGAQQILLRDISRVSPEIRLFDHRIGIFMPDRSFAINGKKKNDTREIAARIQEAMAGMF